MNVIPVDFTQEHMLKIFEETVTHSSNVIIPEDKTIGEWQRITTDRQIIVCLQKGRLVEGPTADVQGNTQFTYERYSAGVCIWVTASLFQQEEQWLIFVTNVEKQS